MKKNSGLSIVPIILGLVLSVIVIGVLLNITMKKNNKSSELARRVATEMSDYGFQELTQQLESIADLANDSVKSVDSTGSNEEWYKLNVQKKINGDTMVITIESIGGSADEIVSQEKHFKLIKTEDSTGVIWAPRE